MAPMRTSSSFDNRSTLQPTGQGGRTVDLTMVKDVARRSLAPGDVGRELVLALPDMMADDELDALFPTIVRVLRNHPRETAP